MLQCKKVHRVPFVRKGCPGLGPFNADGENRQMQVCPISAVAESKNSTSDMAAYFEEGRRLRSAALWNFATHLKPSIGRDDGGIRSQRRDRTVDRAAGQDMEYFLAEGRQLRNRLSGACLFDGARAIFGTLKGLTRG